MKTICLYFQIHQPFRLKKYRFFNIGTDHYYYDDFCNEAIMTRVAEQSYIPSILCLKEMIEAGKGSFKVALSISGTAFEQLEMYVPEFVDHLKDLLKTGCVEILGETYAHSLASLTDQQEFVRQVKLHSKKIEMVLGVKPTTFRNTELIYSDDIGETIGSMGFKGVMLEGAKHILGWKSPNFVYKSASNENLKLLMRNFKLSDDISFRFTDYNWAEYPLTVEKLCGWIAQTSDSEKVFNLYMGLDTFGTMQPGYSGIFEFLKALPKIAPSFGINFALPAEIIASNEAVDTIASPHAFSWTNEDKGISAWLGNRLQQEAFHHLYKIAERVSLLKEKRIMQDWLYLQASDHFYYMGSQSFLSPYDNHYEAFTNYMNILSDFIRRVNEQYPSEIGNEELNSLLTTIHNQGKEIERLKVQLGNSVLLESSEPQSEIKEKPTAKKSIEAKKTKKATPPKTAVKK